MRTKSVNEQSISIRSDMGRERNQRTFASGVSSLRLCEIRLLLFIMIYYQKQADF